MTTQHGAARRQAHVQQIRLEQERQPRRHRQRRLLGLGTVVALVAVVSFGLWQARPTTVDATGATAPHSSPCRPPPGRPCPWRTSAGRR